MRQQKKFGLNKSVSVPHGIGTALLANGDVYQGNFEDGLPSGIGRLLYGQTSAVVVGEFRGKFEPIEHKIEFNDGSSFRGQLYDSYQIGTIQMPNGDEIQGKFHKFSDKWMGVVTLQKSDNTLEYKVFNGSEIASAQMVALQYQYELPKFGIKPLDQMIGILTKLPPIRNLDCNMDLLEDQMILNSTETERINESIYYGQRYSLNNQPHGHGIKMWQNLVLEGTFNCDVMVGIGRRIKCPIGKDNSQEAYLTEGSWNEIQVSGAKQFFLDGSQFEGLVYHVCPHIKIGTLLRPNNDVHRGQFECWTMLKHGYVKSMYANGEVEFAKWHKDHKVENITEQ